jgi:mannose-1-phosphate guanylyltransferase
MKAMLLAAGLGTRLRPITDNIPKCMVSVAGRPVLQHNIEWLRSQGVLDLVINLHYHPQSVTDYFGDGSKFGVRISYSYEPQLLGTSGAVWAARQYFSESPFYVLYADNFIDIDLERFYDAHIKHQVIVSMALFFREDVSSSGVVMLDEHSLITAFKEKPKQGQIDSHWVNAGLLLCETKVLQYIPPDKASDFGYDILPALLAAKESMYGYAMGPRESLYWIDTPEDLEFAENLLKEKEVR